MPLHYLFVLAVILLLAWANLAGRTWCASRRRSRTCIAVSPTAAFLPLLEDWCGQYGYALQHRDDGRHVYQRGHGFWFGAARLEARRVRGGWQLEAYVRLSAGLFTAELALDEAVRHPLGKEGNSVEILPAAMLNERRLELNRLLQALGAPLLA